MLRTSGWRSFSISFNGGKLAGDGIWPNDFAVPQRTSISGSLMNLVKCGITSALRVSPSASIIVHVISSFFSSSTATSSCTARGVWIFPNDDAACCANSRCDVRRNGIIISTAFCERISPSAKIMLICVSADSLGSSASNFASA